MEGGVESDLSARYTLYFRHCSRVMWIRIQNVSGSGCNCFFRAITASLGKDMMKEMLNVSPHTPLTTVLFRRFLYNMYLTNTDIKNMYRTMLSMGIEANNVADLSNILSVDINVAKCIKANSDEQMMPLEARVQRLVECAAEVFLNNASMVSAIEVRVIQNIINNKLLEKYKTQVIIIAGVQSQRLGEASYIKELLTKSIMDYVVGHGNFNGQFAYHFLLTTDSHYMYLKHDKGTSWTTSHVKEFMGLDDSSVQANYDATPETIIDGGKRKKKRPVKK